MPEKKVFRDAFKELEETFVAFFKAPRALWGVNLPYVLEGLTYFGILTILGKYCSENVSLSDLHAGWVYGGVTGGITFAMLLFGGVSDRIGVRKSLAIAFGGMVIGRLLVSLSGTLSLGTGMGSPMFFVMALGLLIMVISYGTYQPAAYAGVKRYTTPKTAAMGYAVVYALMNLGAFLSGPIATFTRKASETAFPPNGLTAVFWVFTAITLFSLLATVTIITKRVDQRSVERVARETKELNQDTSQSEKNSSESANTQKYSVNNWPFMIYLSLTVAVLVLLLILKDKSMMLNIILIGISIVGAVLSGWEFLRKRPDHPFRDVRFVFFIFILIPVQTLFAHNWLTIPYYLDRAFYGGWVSEYFEVLANLNPIIIFIITPIIAGLTARANVYRMMIIGTFVMAAPTFLLAIGPSAVLFIIYILIMSVGEAMWQPRFLQWVAEIAPEGKTGAYMGIGQFPWFLTKLVTSFYSGWFVSNYIPKPDAGLPVRSGEMWLYYSLIAMISPVALLMARKWMLKAKNMN